MDGSRFDDLARGLAAATSRRSLIKAGVGALLGGALGSRVSGNAEAAATLRPVGSICRKGTECQSGICSPPDRTGRGRCLCGNPEDCPQPRAGDVCRAATCGSNGVCGFGPVNVGGACDDGNPCTLDDACQPNGTCAGTPKTCTALDQCHDAGVCNPATGVCSNPAKPDGAPCDDGNACTQTDTCQGGVCVGSNPVICQPLDQCHVAGTCDPATGTCSNPDEQDNTICNDANACTVGDTCQAGTCTGGAPLTCTTTDQCMEAYCDEVLGCRTRPKAQGTPCNADDTACTANDACDGAGTCVPGTPVSCGQCLRCNETSGICEADPTQIGTSCTPTQPNNCFGGFQCSAFGTCDGVNPTICTSFDQCHGAGTCDPITGLCSNPNLPDGTSCDDGNACTDNDSCQAGVCTGTAKNCDDNNACTANSCDPLTGNCVYTPIDCSDGNPCTVDTCDAKLGCINTPKICTASDQCHDAGTCNPETGQCSNPAKANGTACNDGNACTTNDQCQNGTCVGTPVNCSLANATSFCDSNSGTCQISNCNSGFNNCNGITADGCETNVQTDVRNCGSCNNDCGSPTECEASVICASGQCMRVKKANGTACSGGTCCNGQCCPSGGTCCGGDPPGSNFGCCVGACCGSICCEFSNSKCCVVNGTPQCYVGVTPPC